MTSKAFEKQGYDVKVFNTVNPKHSDGIDLFKFIEKEIDAQVFAQVVISTTQNAGKKGEEFWQNTQENLLKALLLHIRFEVEDETKKNMRYLNSILASGDIKKIDDVFKNSTGVTRIAYNIYAQASDTIKQSVLVSTKEAFIESTGRDEINTETIRINSRQQERMHPEIENDDKNLDITD